MENTTQRASRQSVLIDKKGTVRLINGNINVAAHDADMLAKLRELGMVK